MSNAEAENEKCLVAGYIASAKASQEPVKRNFDLQVDQKQGGKREGTRMSKRKDGWAAM